MPEVNTTVSVVLNVLATSIFAFLSLGLGRPVRGHHLSITSICLSSVHGIRYEATFGGRNSASYPFIFTSATFSWSFHLPRPSDPRWCAFTATDILYTSTTSDVGTSKLSVVLWFFPLLFRHTAGPWSDVTIEDLCIRVRRSTETPYWIQRLRANLVSTLLTGEVLRSDMFKTSLKFAGLVDGPDGKVVEEPDGEVTESSEDRKAQPTISEDETEASPNGDCEHTSPVEAQIRRGQQDTTTLNTKPLRTTDADELRFNLVARALHIADCTGRVYAFGAVESQLRRDWTADRGSFALVAEDCRWVRVPFAFERVAPRNVVQQVLSSLAYFPLDLAMALKSPVRATNLYVTRLDVTFDAFRLRDAELVRQAVVLARERTIMSKLDWNDVFFDALSQAFMSG